MPQPEAPGLDSPEAERVEDTAPAQPTEGGEDRVIDPSTPDDLIDPSTQEIPTEPLPEPAIRITIIPGRETDEDVEPGEEVPNVEVDVTTEPR